MRRFLAAIGVLQLATGLLAQTTTSSSSRTIHTVAVGANLHAFTPNTTIAAVGDIVVFDFYPTNHSVIRGEYTNASICGVAGCNPCVPWEMYHTDEEYQGFFSQNQLIDSFGDVSALLVITSSLGWKTGLQFLLCGIFVVKTSKWK